MTAIPERGARVVIEPRAMVGYARFVTRAPSYGLRALVLGRFAGSSLIVVIVEQRGRAVVDARRVAEVAAEMPDESTSDNPVPPARIDALGLAANRID